MVESVSDHSGAHVGGGHAVPFSAHVPLPPEAPRSASAEAEASAAADADARRRRILCLPFASEKRNKEAQKWEVLSEVLSVTLTPRSTEEKREE